MGFDDSGSRLDPYAGSSGGWSEGDYDSGSLDGLGDFSFSDLFTTAADAYKARQAAKTAAAQAAAAQSQAMQAAALRGGSSMTGSTSSFLGMPMKTWLMLGGAGLGAYLLLSRKKKRR